MAMRDCHTNRVFARAPRRQAAFSFIQNEVTAGRPFPSSSQIAAHMGWKHANSARDCLHSLATFDKVIDRTYINYRWVFSLPANA